MTSHESLVSQLKQSEAWSHLSEEQQNRMVSALIERVRVGVTVNEKRRRPPRLRHRPK